MNSDQHSAISIQQKAKPLACLFSSLMMDRIKTRLYVLILAVSCLLILAACDRGSITSPSQLPTAIDPEIAPTEFFLTANAPPTGFSTVSFPQIDANLNLLSGWRYEMTLAFDGTFASTPRETSAETSAQVWFNQLGSARRVVLETTGELIGQEENASFEAVRLGPDTYLKRNGVCLSNAGDDAVRAADVSAGTLIGGVANAQPTGQHFVLNGILGAEAWQYTFTNEDLVLPAIRPTDNGSIAMTEQGELWVIPQHNVVVRFYVTLNVQNAIIFDRQLPVTGQVIIRYDLFDIGVVPNISIPNGC